MRRFALAAGLLLGSGLAGAETAEPPRLLVLFIIDQGRYEHLVRFRPAFQFGLKRLLDKGVSFTDAHQDHAVTATAPGHAALVSGVHPSRSGMVSNQWYDRASERRMYCVEDPRSPILGWTAASSGEESGPSTAGRSPRNLLVSTLPDWIKSKTPGSKIFAVGAKDRAAVVMGGKSANAAFWFDSSTGRFVTSRYYLRQYPDWLADFQRREHPSVHFGQAWQPLPIDTARARSLGVDSVPEGAFASGFPHPIGGLSLEPDSDFYSSFYRTPFMDVYVAELARAILEHEALGADSALDFLGVSFAATDAVGHDYGPHSREVLDVLLRLDRVLGELLEVIDQKVGSGGAVVALSADHGVAPLPELRQERGEPGKRIGVEDVTCFQNVAKKLTEKFGKAEWLLRGLYLNYQTIAERNLRRQEVENELKRLLGSCPAVARAWTRTEIEDPAPASDPFLTLYRHSFHPERSPDLFVQLKEYYLGELSRGTTHGSPYQYDTHVPLVILFRGLQPAEISTRVHTVDLAPTLASLLGIPTPGNLDGIDRGGLLRQP